MELRQRWSTAPTKPDAIGLGDLVVVREGEREILALAVKGSIDAAGIEGLVLLREFGPPSGDKIPIYCGLNGFRGSDFRRLTGSFQLDPPKEDAEFATVSKLAESPANGMLVVFADGERAIVTAPPAGRWMAFDLATGALIPGKTPAFRLPGWHLVWVDGEDSIKLFTFV